MFALVLTVVMMPLAVASADVTDIAAPVTTDTTTPPPPETTHRGAGDDVTSAAGDDVASARDTTPPHGCDRSVVAGNHAADNGCVLDRRADHDDRAARDELDARGADHPVRQG